MDAAGRQRVAILGGGMASLAAAYHLTSQPGWEDRFEVTVYQLGWRLGGKGASSRDLDRDGRIEEHGLHVWFGCYDQAFGMLRACYEELARTPGSPFATLDEAFAPQDETPYFEHVAGRWKVWPVWFPPNASEPGLGGPLPTAWDYLVMLFEVVARAAGRLPTTTGGTVARRPPSMPGRLPRRLRKPMTDGPQLAFEAVLRLARSLPGDPRRHTAAQRRSLVRAIDRAKMRLARRLAPELVRNDRLRRAFIELDLAMTAVRGIVADGVLRDGFDAIDGEDARAWFRRHGALRMTVGSTPMRALYDLYFAYEDGDLSRPSFSAASAVGAVFRLAFAYKGSVVYEMRAGMGEVVVAPIYQALRARGVRFCFFHRVERLELAADRRSVARVHVARQVDLKDGTPDGYEPLIDVDGLPCWPSRPKIDQLKRGGRLGATDLESRWSGWKDAGHRVLEAGRDFDQLVLGISLGGLREIAAELVEDSPAWRDLVERVPTMQTMSAQLWMDRTLPELGWKDGDVPTDAAPEPLDVWQDRSEVIRYEAWPPADGPRSLQYVCGPLPGDYLGRPPSDRAVPAEAEAQVRDAVVRWLDGGADRIWPATRGPEGGFDWRVLHDQAGRAGSARLEAQYLRANIDPSERYVLSVPGSARYRLPADGSGYANLVLAGDWTRTSWNVGCIEAATISGRNAAEVVRQRAASAQPPTRAGTRS